MMDFSNGIRKNDNFSFLKAVEVMQREWEVVDRKVRPKSNTIHSGFLVLCRKVR